MRLLVVGAGSTGGYFGGRLIEAGRDVTFLVRPARAAQLRKDGMHIISPHGDLALTPQLVTADAIAAPYDVVLLTVKAFSLDAAITDLAPAIGPETMIMPVLNGMKHVDTLKSRFGAQAVIGGVCKVAATLDDQGRIVQIARMHELTYGELGGETSARTDALHALLSNAGFDARLSRSIQQELWEKWILLATFGGVNCMMRGTVGDVEAAGGAPFALAFLNECAAVATAAGHPPGEAFMTGARTTMTTKGSPQTSSMYRDLRSGKPVEGDQIVGDMLVRAQAFGLETPLLNAAAVHLKVYQNRQ